MDISEGGGESSEEVSEKEASKDMAATVVAIPRESDLSRY